MVFTPTPVAGAFILDAQPHEDVRGSFSRTYCRRAFEEHGLESAVAQCSLSHNRRCGTLRGLHYQADPAEEIKVVRCVRGAIFDVAVDLRPSSPSYMQHHAVTLTAENRRAFYIPRGCAHGFLVLEDNTDVFYQMSEFYAPERARGVRWNDPSFGIQWPIAEPILLERDATYPDYQVQEVA